MFKPVHGIDGNLVAAITAIATIMYVDDETFCLLQRRLVDGDYTYLLLRASYDYEIVKVTALTANGISIARAQDGTLALPFPIGTEVEFVLTESAIAEIIEQKGLSEINLEGAGIVTVVKNAPNNYTISAPPISITSESPNVLVGGSFPNFVLSAPLLIDCCD
jgi:hypothetical protein